MAKRKATSSDSIRFARRPDDGIPQTHWPVLRVKAPKGLRGLVVLSHDVEGAYTHFAGGRTRPCPLAGCPLCLEAVERRWYGFLAVSDLQGQGCALLELTHGSVGPVDEYFRLRRSLRGSQLELWRAPNRPNGRLHLRIFQSSVLVDGLPEAPNVRKILAKMWRVYQAPQADGEQERALRIASDQQQDVG